MQLELNKDVISKTTEKQLIDRTGVIEPSSPFDGYSAPACGGSGSGAAEGGKNNFIFENFIFKLA